jgi:MFS family permease
MAGGRWRYRHTVLGLFVLAYFGVRFVEFALSVVFADLKSSLGISSFVVGLAVAASTVTYAVAQLPSGALGDRFGERAVVLASLGLTGAASALIALSPSGGFLVLGMALVGLVSGAYYSPATSLLADLFEGTGRAIGVHKLGAQAVGLTGPVVGFVAAGFGWRVAVLLGAAVALPAFVGVRFAVDSRPSPDPGTSVRDRVRPSELTDLLSRPPVAFTTVVAGFAQFVDTAAFSFLPLVLAEYHDLSSTVAGALFSVYFVAVAVAQPTSGWLSDRLGRDPVAAAALLVAVAGFWSLLAADGLPVVTVAVVLVGFGMGWGPPVQSRFFDHLDADERGVGFGLVRTAYIGFAALNGVVVGGAATVAGWRVGVGVLVVASALPAVGLVANRALGIGL